MAGVPADFKDSVVDIIRTEGIKSVTLKVLNTRLEAKYKMDFSAHKAAIDEAVQWAMQLPDIQRELAKAKAEKEAGPIGGKGKKSTKSAKKETVKEVKKVKKPEGYPKPALGAYILFGNDYREKIKADKPDLKNTDILKALGEMWNNASDSEKGKYKKLAEEDKARFERDMAAFKEAGGVEVGRGGKKHAAKKEGPKRGKNAFMFFSADFRSKNTGSIVEISRAAGAAWEKLSEEERKPYEKMAAEDKERYQRELNGSS